MFAAQYGHLDIVEFLLNKGADVKAKNDDGKFLIFFFHCVETICSLIFMKIYLQLKEKLYLVIKVATTNQTQR